MEAAGARRVDATLVHNPSALGISGPALVLIHANFSLKSTNATVATIIMLSVVFSGIVGRYIYSRIHLGMAGRKTKLSELLEDVEALRNAFGEDMEHAPGIEAELKAYEDQAQAFRKSTLGSFRATLFLGATSRRSQSIVKKK